MEVTGVGGLRHGVGFPCHRLQPQDSGSAQTLGVMKYTIIGKVQQEAVRLFKVLPHQPASSGFCSAEVL
jgi:hypothetical protein